MRTSKVFPPSQPTNIVNFRFNEYYGEGTCTCVVAQIMVCHSKSVGALAPYVGEVLGVTRQTPLTISAHACVAAFIKEGTCKCMVAQIMLCHSKSAGALVPYVERCWASLARPPLWLWHVLGSFYST